MFCRRLANGESIDELIGGPSGGKNCKAAVAQITQYWGKGNEKKKKDKATASNEESKKES